MFLATLVMPYTRFFLRYLSCDKPSNSCQVNKRCRFLLDFEKEVKNALSDLSMKDHPFGGQDINASSLGWAMSAVSSRAFRLYGKKSLTEAYSDMPMMLPLIDMCNHNFEPNARIVQEQGGEQPDMLVKACLHILAFCFNFCFLRVLFISGRKVLFTYCP